MKFRKKPVVVDAVQLEQGMNYLHWIQEAEDSGKLYFFNSRGGELMAGIHTLEGLMIARNRDWLIRGVQGEIYPCKPDIFELTYEQVEA